MANAEDPYAAMVADRDMWRRACHKAEYERDWATLRAKKAEVALSEVLRLVEERFGTAARREVALGAVFASEGDGDTVFGPGGRDEATADYVAACFERDEARRVSRVLAEQYLDELCGYLRGRQFSFMSDEEEAIYHLGYTVDEWLEIDVGEPQWKAIKARWERGIRSVIDAAGRYEGPR